MDKSCTDSELCWKILRSLPRSWEAKITTIQEAKDLTCLKLEELLGSLMTYELTLNQQEKEEMKKKKSIALAIKIKKEDRKVSEEDTSDSEVVLLARRIRNFMKKKRASSRKKFIDRGKIEKGGVVCHNCNKVGYIRMDYPKLREKPKAKKKALVATWSDSEESSFDDEHQECTNLCLMAHENEVSSNLDSYLSIDELYEALDELMKECKKLKKKRKKTITSNQDLSCKLELVTKEKEYLIKKNKKVNQKCDELEKHNINLTNELNATKK